jgi:hypothetical protein
LDIPPFTISYAPVEAALARTYRIAPGDMIAFRGRLAGLQKAGLFEESPGKGHKLVYTPDHLHRLVFCCELASLGVPPREQLKLVAKFWRTRISKIFAEAENAVMHHRHGDDDVILLLTSVDLMAGAWSGNLPEINRCTRRTLDGHTALAMSDAAAPRTLVSNLSAVLRKFHAALVDYHHLHEEPKPTKIVRRRRSR